MRTIDVTVPVPSEKVADFYRWFADWVEEIPCSENRMSANGAVAVETLLSDQDLDAATRWWRLLKPRERQVFSLWIDASPDVVSATDMVTQLVLNGPRDIPGILSWPRRKGTKVGFSVKWSFRHDAISEEPVYGIEDPAFADLLRRARAAVENT